LLSTHCWDMEWNRGTPPFQDTVNKTDDEEENSHIRNEDGEERVQTDSFCADHDKEGQQKNPKNRIPETHNVIGVEIM